jgi:hypothetical protein
MNRANRLTSTFFAAVTFAAQIAFVGCNTSALAAETAKDGTSGPLVLDVGFASSYPTDPVRDKQPPRVSFWIESSLQRVFPTQKPGDQHFHGLAARNGRFSFQACLRNDRPAPVDVECSVPSSEGLKISVRRVGFVPQWNFTADVPPSELDGWGHVPGLVPDPLYPQPRATVGPYAAQSFWITVEVAKDAKPGLRKLPVTFTSASWKQPVTLNGELEISRFVVQPRKDFHVTHWWNADAIYDWYKQPVFGEAWWKMAPAYLNDMVQHGSDVILVPIFYMRREIVARPSQLLLIDEPSPGKYVFDWSRVRRFVELGKKTGFQKFEWGHFWTYKVVPTEHSVDNPQRLYKWVDGKAQLLWPKDTPATGSVYRNFLSQFLPEFHRFLVQEGILEKSYFHLSDEPGETPKDLTNYREARGLLKELAPWMKVMDAMSDIRYGRDPGITDIPVPAVHAAKGYIDEKIPHWVYYCTGPRGPYLNRFFDTPLSKIRMNGWLFYRLGAQGFLHWGYNYWYVMDLSFNKETQVLVDPFTDGAAGTTAGGAGEPYGDSFVVYPGANGPIDSIRWEVFAESLQDYAILQTAGIKPTDPMLAEIKTYADFPKNERWIQQTLKQLLQK